VTERDFDIAELESILELPEDHPRRVALSRDPRFRATSRSYQRFVAAGEQPADAATARAEARLADAIDRTVLGRAATRPPLRPWFSSYRSYLVGGLAAALVLVLLVARDDVQPPPPGQALRWEPSTTPESVRLLPDTPVALAGDRLLISWYRLPAAEGYAVEFYRSDLVRVATRDAAAETSLTVDCAVLRGPGGPSLFRVLATAGADTIGRSAPGLLSCRNNSPR